MSETTRTSIQWRQIADGIHVTTLEPDHVNIGLVVGAEGCLLIDTGSTPTQGRQLHASIAAVTDVPLRGALVTHDHRDHWFGLSAFTDLETWGHESLDSISTDGSHEADLAALGLNTADLVRPSHPFSLAVAIDLGGGVRVEALHLGEAHSRSDVLVLVPGVNVLFAGDLVEFDGVGPWFDEHSSPKGWPGVLNMAMSMITADTIVVPGHGEVGGRDDLVAQMGALSGLPFEAERLVREGVPFERAEAEGEWPLPWERISAGVRRAYDEMNALGVRTRLPLTTLDLDD